MLLRRLPIVLCLLTVPCAALAQTASPVTAAGAFEVHLDQATFTEPFTGDLFVAFAGQGEPRRSMGSWFTPPPLLRFHVGPVEPGGSLTLTAAGAAAHFPVDWSAAAGKPWSVQAVARRSRTGREPGLDEGDVFSQVVQIDYAPDSSDAVRLDLAEVVPAAPVVETDRVKLFELVSPSLSRFHGFDYTLRAGVLLPSPYDPHASYPVVYSVTGFGGTWDSVRRWEGRAAPGTPLGGCILVVPDATNRYGHSVFCDSRSIGPWGHALVEELIPALEARFGGAGAEHRYVTGVSSGGWSSLWLQVAYPETFAGCWSHCPDPIDFHDFQGIDLYDPLPDGTPRSMYVDEHGVHRPLARRGKDQVLITYEDFVRHEDVLNPGGQIRSFEATFSAPGPDGTPRRVFDVATGTIDHAAAADWRPYDIADRLLTHWDELRPRLAGKIHLFAGELDTFYLQGAVQRFRAEAEKRGMLTDMEVEIVPGMPHTLHEPGELAMERTIQERWLARTAAHASPH